MAVDLGPALELSLRDATNQVWTADEIDDILDWALDQANQVRRRSVRDTITLADDDDQYDLVTVYNVSRVDILDSDNKLVAVMPPGTWEVWGDNNSPAQTLYINPSFARTGYKLRVHGYAPYVFTGSTGNPDTTMQNAIMSLARAEALRRLASDRARFRQWAQTNPKGDMSVSELIGIINEADAEAQRLLRGIKLIMRPTVGRMAG